MRRATQLAVGLTLIFFSGPIFWWILTHNAVFVGGALAGSVFLFPGSLLVGMAIWPPDDNEDEASNENPQPPS